VDPDPGAPVRARWPVTPGDLIRAQRVLADLAAAALDLEPWTSADGMAVGGCFVAYAAGEAGPGRAGDRAWAAAVVWRPASAPVRRDGSPYRDPGRVLRGTHSVDGPRRATDVDVLAVVGDRVPGPYQPGLLALREGPVLGAAVALLDPRPDVLLVDATGLDHPRSAGLALHLGAVAGLPTVGVTRRPFLAGGDPPPAVRGATSLLRIGHRVVGCWVCTRTGARPVAAHAAWRTGPETAADVVLAASTEAARTPVPLQEARRVAREARSLAGQSRAAPGTGTP
jgi:deoxyribonuclease V